MGRIINQGQRSDFAAKGDPLQELWFHQTIADSFEIDLVVGIL